MDNLSKRPRLKDFSYLGTYRYFITINAANYDTPFTEELSVNTCLTVLENLSVEKGFSVWAYCFMPDHLHLLIQGLSENSNLKTFVSLFKQKTGYSYKQRMDSPLWQTSYYDHVLRTEEDSLEIAKYIFNNPVRKGLVEYCSEYPFSGSFEFEMNNIFGGRI